MCGCKLRKKKRTVPFDKACWSSVSDIAPLLSLSTLERKQRDCMNVKWSHIGRIYLHRHHTHTHTLPSLSNTVALSHWRQTGSKLKPKVSFSRGRKLARWHCCDGSICVCKHSITDKCEKLGGVSNNASGPGNHNSLVPSCHLLLSGDSRHQLTSLVECLGHKRMLEQGRGQLWRQPFE